MSLSEQMASTPSPPVSRLIQAAAAVLRAAGWTVTPPAGDPENADLVPDPGGNYRLQWRAQAGQAPNDGADGKVTLKVFGVRPTRDGRVALRDPDTGEIEIVSWETATEMGLWPTRIMPPGQQP